MDQDHRGSCDGARIGAPSGYEAPKIETVLTAEDLEREVQYAGNNHTSPTSNP